MIWRIIICLSRTGESHCPLYLASNRFTNIFEIKPSFRDGPKDQTSDVQLHIGESLDSGFALRAPRNDVKDYAVAARSSRSAAARASAVISAPASIRPISSRRWSAATALTGGATPLPLSRASSG